MRPIEQKILHKINDKSASYDDILEWIDAISTQEMKKSFPDDCHFQSAKYFAKIIVDNLLRNKLIVREGNRFSVPKKENEKSPEKADPDKG